MTAPVVFALALAFISLWAATGGVSAQEGAGAETGVFHSDDLEMVVKAGFSKLEVNNWMGSWVPFRVTIVNQGRPISGRLVVHCESQNNPTPQVREYVKEIQLPTGSRQLHEIAAFLNSGEDPIVRIQTASGIAAEAKVRVERSYGWSDQLEVGVVDTDSTALNNITSTEITRQQNREPFKKVAAPPAQNQAAAQSTASQSTAAQAGGAQGPPPPPGQPRRTRRGMPGSGQPLTARPTVIAPEDMPRDFISYDALDAVVINDAPLNQLSEEQARALRMWVASGGLLVVTGGSDVAGMRVMGLDQLLPVEAQSAATTSSLALQELNQIYGPFETGDQLTGMMARLKQGARSLVGMDDRPIVAERNYGSGLVRFVAFNPKLNPYRGWAAAKDLWSDLLLPAAESKPKHANWITFGRRGNNSSNRWGVQGFLYKLAQIEPPSPKYFILFLVSYVLAVGPANYLILRWRRKTDLAWLTIPAVVLVFTIVSVTAAQMTRGGDSLMADVSLVELHQGEGIMNVNSGLLIMPTSKGTQQLTFEGRDTYASDVTEGNQTSSASASGNIESERGPREFILRVPMTTWTSGIFQARSVKEGSQPLVSAEGTGDAITIKNLGGARMLKAVYLGPSGVSGLFDLEPGKEQQVALGSPQSSPFNAWYQSELGQGGDEGELFPDLASVLDRQIGGDRAITQGFFDTQLMSEAIKRLERPLLIYFVDDNPSEIGFRGSLKRRSKSLYVVHL
ncbi:MAG TPA: hypothetical protein VNI02_22995 [Blastocatellia bacterium]|nr:hypothetical protein [Blastocatellia bacterium]